MNAMLAPWEPGPLTCSCSLSLSLPLSLNQLKLVTSRTVHPEMLQQASKYEDLDNHRLGQGALEKENQQNGYIGRLTLRS